MTVMLYKPNGSHKIHGGMFDYIIVDDSEVDTALSDGWFRTTTEAKESVEGDVSDAPPSRKELEQKANQLKINFAPNISDNKLFERINKALQR